MFRNWTKEEKTMKKNLMNVVTFLLAVLVVIFVAIHFSNNAAKTKQINGLKDDVAALTADAEEKTKQLETLNKDAEDKAAAASEAD